MGNAFHRNALKTMFPLFEKRTKLLIENLNKYSGSSVVINMQTEFQKLTFDVIGLVSMGIDFGSQKSDDNEYENAWEAVLTQLMFQFYCPLPKWAWSWLTFVPRVRNFNKGIEFLENAIQKSIQLRRNHQIHEDDCDLLSIMIKQQQDSIKNGNPDVFVDKTINRELLTFMFAGHDTTRSTLCWVLVCFSGFFCLSKLRELNCSI